MTLTLLLIFYFFILLVIGFRSKVNYNIQDFFLGNRKFNSFSLAISLSATIIGSSATVGLIGLASRVGLPAIWWLLSGAIGLFVLSFFINKVVILDIKTISDIFRIYYSDRIEKLASLLIVISWTSVIAGQLIATSKLINVYTGYDNISLIKTLFFFIIIFYVFLGGQKAVIKTDIFQFFLILPAISILFYFLASNLNDKQITLDFLKFPYNNFFTLKKVFSFFLVLFPMYLIGPDIYSRILAVHNKNIIKKSLFIAIFFLLVFSVMITFIGIWGNSILGLSGENLAFDLIKIQFGKIFSFVILFGFLSAFMSSADTCFLTATSILVINIFKFKKVLYNKLIILAYAILTFIITLKFSSILDALMFGYKIFVTGLFVPFLMPLLFKKYHFFELSAIASIIWAFLTTIISIYWKSDFLVFINIFGSFLIFTVTNILVSLIHR